MRNPIIGLFLFGCGSADPNFGATLSVELDGGVDARAVMASGGSGGQAASSGGAVNSGGVTGQSCGPDVMCNSVDSNFFLECRSDSDCCKNMRCLIGSSGYCVMLDHCISDDDCPCGMVCRPRDGAVQPCTFERGP